MKDKKECTKCGVTKHRTAFPAKSESTDGMASACKKCRDVRPVDSISTLWLSKALFTQINQITLNKA